MFFSVNAGQQAEQKHLTQLPYAPLMLVTNTERNNNETQLRWTEIQYVVEINLP